MRDDVGFERPVTEYARADDAHVGYQVVGDGPIDLLFVPGWVSNIELVWEEPRQADFLRSLSEFARLILFDKRGTGVSDPVSADRPPTLEDRLADANAVLDAVGSDQTAVFGFSEGGSTSALFAATYPERTSALVLWGATPRISWAEDWPWGLTRDEGIAQLKSVEAGEFLEHFGVEYFAPSLVGDAAFLRWAGRYARMSASPAMYIALLKTNGATDVRGVLPSITAPTLVLHRKGDRVADVRTSEYLAEHIPDAQLITLAGEDHWPWVGDTTLAVAEIQQFLVGTRPAPRTDRFLTTVLFTDIVDSTQKAEELGDRAWSDLLDTHDRFTREELSRFNGEWVKGTGDGALAIFDGPARAVDCARSLLRIAEQHGLQLRAGIHTGEAQRRGSDVAGLAVHISARVSARAQPNEVLVTSIVKDLVAGSGISFENRGTVTLKGVPGEWLLLAVSS